MAATEKLRGWGELDTLELLHFHLGSQISAIRSIKDALREAARLYVELHKLGCTGLRFLDVGGGLGVDYDGSQTNFASSMNYSIQEYANDVVWHTQQACDAAGVPHPDLVSESGRAVAAHHAVLIVDVLGVSEASVFEAPRELPPDAPPVARNLFEAHEHVNGRNYLEAFHDAVSCRDEVRQLFNLGHLSLEMRVVCERLFWAISRKILGIIRTVPQVPEEIAGLDHALADTFFLNFSLFQSVPDSWAVDQLFPVIPIHRLNEEPTRRAVIADITCDSDGRIDQFISQRDIKRVLELHQPRENEGYYLGFFLVGAYQEILGDLHNLFGDTNAVHVALAAEGRYEIEEVFNGDTVSDVLGYMSYSPKGLIKKLRQHVETAIKAGRMNLDESRQLVESYTAGLYGYTYLEGEAP
jgi:arginine decarboxylase